MSHKSLAEKYAQQLHNAHKHILELETTIADREYALEQAQAGRGAVKKEDNEEAECLQSELAQKADRISELEALLKQQDVDVEEKNRLKSELAKKYKDISEFQECLQEYVDHEAELRAKLSRAEEEIQGHQAALEGERDRAAADVQTAQSQIKSIEQKADAEVAKLQQDNRQLVRQLEYERSNHNAQAGPGNDRIKFLEKALEESNRLTLSQSADSLKIENDHLVKCIRETSGEKFDLRRKVTQMAKEAERVKAGHEKAKIEREKMEAESEKADEGKGRILEQNYRREVARRIQLEQQLRTRRDSARCKKCSPVVIDLEGESEDSEEGEGGDKAPDGMEVES